MTTLNKIPYQSSLPNSGIFLYNFIIQNKIIIPKKN